MTSLEKPREKLVLDLGEELGESIYKQLTINEEYLQHNLTNLETNMLLEYMYARIFELIYAERYPKKDGKK